MKPNDPSLELQPVIESVCQLYCQKIAADLQADSSHIRRQTLPEFMYSTYLFMTGEPSAAKHALTEFVALVYYFEKVIVLLSTMKIFFNARFVHCIDIVCHTSRVTPGSARLENSFQTHPVWVPFFLDHDFCIFPACLLTFVCNQVILLKPSTYTLLLCHFAILIRLQSSTPTRHLWIVRELCLVVITYSTISNKPRRKRFAWKPNPSLERGM
jgi:hypothetical protein